MTLFSAKNQILLESKTVCFNSHLYLSITEFICSYNKERQSIDVGNITKGDGDSSGRLMGNEGPLQ